MIDRSAFQFTNSPARFEEAKENLQEIRADSFIVDHINTIQTLGGLFSQLEMDRLWNSVAIVRSYHLYKSQVFPIAVILLRRFFFFFFLSFFTRMVE